MSEERLQKVIANAGVTSRRKAEALIQSGRVKVNDKVIKELGVKVGPGDEVSVDGLPIEREKRVYFLLYKPRGVISAVTDDKGRKTVSDFFVDIPQRVYPVGRLDYDTSGLLIMTNDGQLANLLMHPRYEVDKTYIAKVGKIPDTQAQIQLRKGVYIDKRKTAHAKVSILSSDRQKDTAIVKITIHEGMNHQVKKMFEAVGSKVIKLARESFGFLDLTGLSAGQHRPLSHQEVEMLRTQAQGNDPKKIR
ncbi:16S rRNA pseudouridylate synthase [Agrilactobacillus composti DSM 18527 = JCM 14202]|uniref:Pseudouridine synthase n=1 Tax=Agrilactobacillus composti DSM 18527 = JCM 14202 TaxID=1423734 RepID=X0PQ11_9LACO|nr:pseudouridine synthase [Agrilactobacillus composti]KRM36561.1 16S rRNA pseudouridylate synthase [Agrilactobacillus composti DSM 18527 = JCM 14202]GAF39121.1 ribosomal large subunit pseudouridine synthase B [Agrilactobacillus composti DSM 18527 = JCM 14202]